MVIIGGLGTVMGALPRRRPSSSSSRCSSTGCSTRWCAATCGPGCSSQLELVCFGALIIFFLIVEPRGFARLWQIGKEKLRLWPFPH